MGIKAENYFNIEASKRITKLVNLILSTILLCFCSFYLFCPLLGKDISIENVYIVLSCPIKMPSFKTFFQLNAV